MPAISGRLDLFSREEIVGVFRGFCEGGMEFHADLVLPYRSDFHNIPMHGQFLLVQLETPDESVLGRITSLSSAGRLSDSAGEEFNLRAMRENRPIPDDLRRDYLKYRVNIRVLGVLRVADSGGLTFVPSHRRLPHVGSPVAFAGSEVLREIAGHYLPGAELGFLALGEYIYAAGDQRLASQDWMQVKEPAVVVKFPVDHLVSRRMFVFARAGFGKSNLIKLLFSRLYATTPTVPKRGARRVPVGTVLFDPDGEYFWPDDRGRPGLCDVPELKEQVVVFTSRQPRSAFYGSFIAGDIKLDIRRLRPADVASIALSPERQEQQNVRKIKGLNQDRWCDLVDLIHEAGNNADLKSLKDLLSLDGQQDVEALAARANMTSVVRMLHDPSSQLMDMLLEALTAGKLCIVDVSQLRGGSALTLSGLILKRIFDRNQEEFIKAQPQTIPTIAVVEEAQAVLNSQATAADPYIAWVKEGRKYDLGAILITQQPGSIPREILSQGDNWFIFHLLSSAGLQNVRKANAHFSTDLLAALLNEPIVGQGVFWSSVGGKPYPVPLRVLSFESLYEQRDKEDNLPAVETYASRLRSTYARKVEEARLASQARARAVPQHVGADERNAHDLFDASGMNDGYDLGTPDWDEMEAKEQAADADEPTDVLRLYKDQAIDALRRNPDFQHSIENHGIPWGTVKAILRDALSEVIPDRRERDQFAYDLVKEAVSIVLEGDENVAWETERRQTKGGKITTFIVKKRKG